MKVMEIGWQRLEVDRDHHEIVEEKAGVEVGRRLEVTPMRRKDWADDEAERLFDLVRGAIDDNSVIEEISKSLRKAARDLRDERITGPVGDHPDG